MSHSNVVALTYCFTPARYLLCQPIHEKHFRGKGLFSRKIEGQFLQQAEYFKS